MHEDTKKKKKEMLNKYKKFKSVKNHSFFLINEMMVETIVRRGKKHQNGAKSFVFYQNGSE